MLKSTRLRTAAIITLSIFIFSFGSDLAYRDVLAGQLKMLIPTDFIRVPKESYKPHYEDDKIPDDYYCNSDTSVYVGFVKLPWKANDMSQAKQAMQMATLDSANKIHFNDTLTVNGNKLYLLDMDGMDEGKRKFLKMFFINTKESSVMGIITCNIALKKTWSPMMEQMFKSIKIN
jgi:hypothetical protein